MVPLSLRSLLAIAGCITSTAAQGNKPVINPLTDYTRIEERWKSVPNKAATTVNWLNQWFPKGCWDAAKRHNLNPWDFSAWDVKYPDCNQVWVMCRHKDAPASRQDLINNFGKLPVGIRSYVRHVLATPSLGATAWWEGPGDITFQAQPTMHVMVHESSHGLDFLALQQFGSPFSETSIWKDSFNKDKSRPSEYSGANWVENFAEAGIIAVFDKNFPNELAQVQPKWTEIQNQIRTYQQYLGNTIVAGGQCQNRIANSPTVHKDTGMPGLPGARVANVPQADEAQDQTIGVIEFDSSIEGLRIEDILQ